VIDPPEPRLVRKVTAAKSGVGETAVLTGRRGQPAVAGLDLRGDSVVLSIGDGTPNQLR
jgi:hypothetical protein